MNLADIDELVKLKQRYHKLKEMVEHLQRADGQRMPEGSITVTTDHLKMSIDWGTVGKNVVASALKDVTVEYDKVIAQLAVLGVEDWNTK